eukprot:COSAG05_NODE_6193_length_1002_cov_1.699889_2_plen_110_part_00
MHAEYPLANLDDDVSEATGDFLFRLGPGAGPVAYRPTGKNTEYQGRGPGSWPIWGSGYDLSFGQYGALGQRNAYCAQGDTYAGETNDACGSGNRNWGATEMEVWYRVGS